MCLGPGDWRACVPGGETAGTQARAPSPSPGLPGDGAPRRDGDPAAPVLDPGSLNLKVSLSASSAPREDKLVGSKLRQDLSTATRGCLPKSHICVCLLDTHARTHTHYILPRSQVCASLKTHTHTPQVLHQTLWPRLSEGSSIAHGHTQARCEAKAGVLLGAGSGSASGLQEELEQRLRAAGTPGGPDSLPGALLGSAGAVPCLSAVPRGLGWRCGETESRAAYTRAFRDSCPHAQCQDFWRFRAGQP